MYILPIHVCGPYHDFPEHVKAVFFELPYESVCVYIHIYIYYIHDLVYSMEGHFFWMG